MAVAAPPPRGGGGGHGPDTLEDLLTSLNRPSTLSELIERIGLMEQERITRTIEAEIQRINGVVEKHQWAARARETTQAHQDELLEITADELRTEISQVLYLRGERARQEVEALTLAALRQLPPDYRSLSVHDAFRLVPGGHQSAKAEASSLPIPATSSQKGGQVLRTELQERQEKQMLARMQEMDSMREQLASAAAQLERLPTDERRKLYDQLKSRSERVVGSCFSDLGAPAAAAAQQVAPVGSSGGA
uniref:Uncharacterized protein n=1 Tax=Alexandrium monilatum TaxID=311494 RepID=A0A7S4Q030_9DINO|mmetsp:Transcript_6194/g.19544  ORF Transcript_6194/g.19544 Transcript_6194/m.19544 type:complete len:249 (+) Transcript_6194:82-828(+)